MAKSKAKAKNPCAKKLATGSVPSAKKGSCAKSLGSSGGKKGGPARAAALSPKERTKIAEQGAKARWKSSADINKPEGTYKAHAKRKKS
jgi:hypothetical protein